MFSTETSYKRFLTAKFDSNSFFFQFSLIISELGKTYASVLNFSANLPYKFFYHKIIMASQAAMRTFLRDVIGITDAPGPDPAARRVAIQEEGLLHLDDLVEFDKDGIKSLCSSVRKPGGQIPDPNNVGQVIPNPGFNIPAICEKRLQLACYAARTYALINRGLSQDGLSRARLKLFEQHEKMVKEHVDPEKLPSVDKNFGIVRAMDLLPSHLRDRLGVAKVPLSYIIRSNETPSVVENLAPNKATGETYNTIMDELIACIPLSGEHYNEDNAKVFQIIQDMITGTSFEASIKAHQRRRDGRAAYLSLCQHNLGSSKWDKIVEEAETYMMKREWNGKNYRFTLRNHISKHREAFNEMVRAAQFIPYEVPNEHTRVGRLIKSLQSKDPAIVSAITHIQGNPNHREDFENAADFLLLTAPKFKDMTEGGQRISSIRSKGNKSKPATASKSGVEFRYYAKNEYRKLNKAQKKELAEWRETEKGSNQKVAALEQQLREMRDETESLRATIASINVGTQSNQSRGPLDNPLTQRN